MHPMRVPLVDLAAQQAEIADEVRAGLDEVFETTAFIDGPAVRAFEPPPLRAETPGAPR